MTIFAKKTFPSSNVVLTHCRSTTYYNGLKPHWREMQKLSKNQKLTINHYYMFFKKKNKIKALEITDTSFNELIQETDEPILIDFWANWCGPCKIIGPVIDELAREYEGRAVVGKVNVEVNPNLQRHFGVKSIPTLMLIHRGELKQRFAGMVTKPDLQDLLEHYITEGEASDEEE